MIFVVTKCAECPFMGIEENELFCNLASPQRLPISDKDQRPDWCGLRSGQRVVRDFPGSQATHVVSTCAECPFLSRIDGCRACNAAIPRYRPMRDEEERPFWCKMRKEQIIVRDFK